MKYTYLLIDFFTIIVPFIFSFHPKLNFYKTWKAFFPAVILTGLIFIIWDVYFTSIGVWGFNEQYLIGSRLLNLPIEEILFFFCIPYACVFTYHCLDIFIKHTLTKKIESIFTVMLIICLILGGLMSHDNIYTTVTFFGLSAILLIAKYILKISWLAKFYIIYTVLLFPFIIVNGLLTGTGLENPVVWYNEAEILGFRILTIPIEDVFYGMGLIFINLLLYKYFIALTERKSI
ncbi:lycopene cyclase domain-containing protein [Pedobacter frigoris]|uniref:Lycopene cyclase domain-containing protein n=1 Tax=Pedobacter frigoris TaxID=2571272 RepID=A0A4V5P2T5_9SPHI|nr:lycopene cyclase domain-containing protein [Pedobacter frigoris]TKC09582.1 lycopene cyclase domain-containing protein [Pedobacter frigoris]